jgi:hypothetical protein
MRNGDVLKIAIVLIVLFFVGGFLFSILFKIGILALIVLGVLYLFKRVFR